MRSTPHIEAEIRFLTTEEGGRRGYVVSGYRPQFFYDGQDHDAVHEFPDADRVLPGQTVRVHITFFHPENHIGRLYPGKKFSIREGVQVVAEGRVTNILNLEGPPGE